MQAEILLSVNQKAGVSSIALHVYIHTGSATAMVFLSGGLPYHFFPFFFFAAFFCAASALSAFFLASAAFLTALESFACHKTRAIKRQVCEKQQT